MRRMDPQGFFGPGENGYLFSGSWGNTGNYFSGAWEQAHSFGDLVKKAKKKKKKKKKKSHCLLFSSTEPKAHG